MQSYDRKRTMYALEGLGLKHNIYSVHETFRFSLGWGEHCRSRELSFCLLDYILYMSVGVVNGCSIKLV